MITAYAQPTPSFIPSSDTGLLDILGILMEWKLTERDTGQQYCLLEMRVPAGAIVPIHHHAPAETFLISEGAIEFGRHGETGVTWTPVAQGGLVHVPSWAYHGFRNVSDAMCRIQLTCGAGLEGFFIECGVPIDGGNLPTFSPPAPDDIARVIEVSAKHGSYFLPMER